MCIYIYYKEKYNWVLLNFGQYFETEVKMKMLYQLCSSSHLRLRRSLDGGHTPCNSLHIRCPPDTGTVPHTLEHTQGTGSSLSHEHHVCGFSSWHLDILLYLLYNFNYSAVILASLGIFYHTTVPLIKAIWTVLDSITSRNAQSIGGA